MNIAICDDDFFSLNETHSFVSDFVKSNLPLPNIIEKFSSPDQLLKETKSGRIFELYILDIIMPIFNGIELAKELRKNNPIAKFIFFTITPEFAISSYDVEAIHYLLKPLDQLKFGTILRRTIDRIQTNKVRFIQIKEYGNLINIDVNSILFIEVIKHKIHYHLKDNRVITDYGSLKEVVSQLADLNYFIKCHKSYVVNLNFTEMIIDHAFRMRNVSTVPISRKYYRSSRISFLQRNKDYE